MLAEAIGRRAAEQHVRHQALHDPLTGLPNRTLLLERIGHWIDRAARSHDSAALFFVDLDSRSGTLRDGQDVAIPVRGGHGRFRDAWEFLRFLDRVTGDLRGPDETGAAA